jgi:uncharacterized protein YrrD
MPTPVSGDLKSNPRTIAASFMNLTLKGGGRILDKVMDVYQLMRKGKLKGRAVMTPTG